MDADIPVVVTTAHRGVFFGYMRAADDPASPTIRLSRARMCLYWPTQVRGVLGLCTTGPLNDSRVGPPAPGIVLQGVTAVMEVSEAAVLAWESEPWAN